MIQRSNDSPYGLAAGVWSQSIDTCLACADGLDAGTIWINGNFFELPVVVAVCDKVRVVKGMMSSWGYQAPFGGPKQTGGGKTNGKQGLEEYLTTKSISIQLTPSADRAL
eukprot:SAG31_NODE_10480_length_1133_cov_1.941006_1_plen_110_part_00